MVRQLCVCYSQLIHRIIGAEENKNNIKQFHKTTMKKLSVLGMLILVAMFSFTAKADIVTLDGANEIANAFFANSASSQKKQMKSTTQLEYAWDSNSLTQKGSSMMKSVDEDPTFYVFNNPDGEGFVIVSGDDNARSVIGYSYEANIPAADEIPAPMQDYLLGIDEEIKWARTNLTSGNKNLKTANESIAGTPVTNITTAKWSQGSPFNNLCPKVMVEDAKGSYTVEKRYYNYDTKKVETITTTASEVSTSTGCVPTAFAIVMRYHGWPTQGTGTISGSYTYDLYSEDGYRIDIRKETIDHSATTYDWNNMPLTYSLSWTEYQKTQVATLMRNLGYAFSATYSPGNTFVNDVSYVPDNVLNCFGYKVEEVVYGNYNTSGVINDIDEWKRKLKSSLNNNCPIPYAANNSGTGDSRHMFVVDDYTNSDYFHFNFGWGGSANGWFTLKAVATSAGDNYSWTENGARHRAYINFQPNKKVTVSVAVDGEGSVTIDGASGTLKEVETGTQVTLQATDSNFYGWMVGNDVVSTENPYTFTATATQTYTAKFLSEGNTVEIYHDYLQIDDEDIKANCSVTGLEEKGASYPLGVNLTITANCERGYKFNGWYTVDWNTSENILLSTENPYSFETSEELAVISYSFTKLSPASFAVTTADETKGTATWSFQGGQGDVYAGEEITLTAEAKSGYMFTGWSDGTSTISNSKTCTVAVEEGKTYTANFALAGADYTVSYNTGTFGDFTYNSRASVWKYNTSETNPVLLQLTATNASGAEVGAIYKTSNRLYAYGAEQTAPENYSLTTPTTYTLSVPDGFIITSYTLDYIVGASYSGKVTIANANSSNTPTDTQQYTLSASNLSDSSTSFTITGNANTQYVTVKSFIVSVLSTGGEVPEPEPDPEPEVSDETLALIQSAKTLVALEGIGYPAATAKATLQSSIATAEANPTAEAGTTLQTAIDAYYATTDIVKPEAGKTYTFIVGHTSTKSYIYNNNGVLSLATYSGGELPSTAHFTCEVADGKYMFVSDGKYMPYPKYDNGNLQTTTSIYTKFTVRKIVNGGNVSATNQDLFGLVYLEGTRYHNSEDQLASIVVKYADATNNPITPIWDAANTPFAGPSGTNGYFTSAIKIEEVTPVTPTTYTASVTAGEGGTATVMHGTTPASSSITVTSGTEVTFYAVPDQGYRFLGWTKGASATYESENTTYNVTVTENISLVANFEAIPLPTYNVNISVNGNGSVEKSVESVQKGGEVTLTATAEDGYKFTKWSDESTENPRTITSVTDHINLTAYFEAIPQGNKPLLTFACLSDLHAQYDLINDENDIQLRESVTKTLSKIKEEENVDLIVLGGDYTSNNTIPETSWEKTRKLLVNATRGAFNGTKTPVIYVNGNHEFEVANCDALPKSYNAGEYYGTPMKTDIGELREGDYFYETASNGTGTSVNLLAAYHYVVNGFDFVVLNTGKNFFASASNYSYSIESVEWCASKLAEIYAKDKDKTVFFLVHIPFGDSKGLNTGKGMVSGDAATLLKSTLAKYPNLIMLYGHDHGGDSAYIRTSTSQRVTEYATDGSVYTGSGAAQENIVYYVQNYNSSKFLGHNNKNLATTITQTSDVNLIPSVVSGCEGAFLFDLTNYSGDRRYVHCGSSDHNYSGNANNSGVNQQIYLYKVADPTAATITATLSTTVEDGKTYMLVARNSATGTAYYALSDEMYQEGTDSQRMIGVEVTVTNNTITYNRADYSSSLLWTINEKGSSSEKSFFSSFMGSMRYYSNTIENVNGSDDQLHERNIVQALMVYVYSDRVALKMKNYAKSGTFGTITINEDLDSYVSERTVTHSEEQVTATPDITSAGGVVAPDSSVTVTVEAPEWHKLYYTLDGTEPTEKSTRVDGREFTFTPSTTGKVTVKVAAQEGIRLISASDSVTYTVMNTHGITVSTNGEGGTASFTIEGTNVILTASEPTEGYEFVGWSVGESVDIVSTDNPYTTTILENAAYKANFAKQTFNVNVSATNGGTVKLLIAGEETQIPATVEYGTEVTFSAEANQGCQFVNWTDAEGNPIIVTEPEYTHIVKSDITLTANFREVTPEEIYEEMCKPTITNIGNVIEVTNVDIENAVRGAVIGTVSLENVPTMSRVIASANYTRYVGATDPITIWPGAEFDLELTLNTGTWYGAQFYQIHNSTENIVASYGYYGAKGESANEALFWTEVSDDNRVVANQTNKTLTFHIALSDEVKAGDIVVFRALLAKNQNEEASVDPCATYSQGSYLDILFKVIEPTERTVTIESNDRDLGYPEIVQPTPSTIGQSSITTSGPVTVRANIQHDAYCRFVNWTIEGEVVGTNPDSYTYERVADATITANFVETCMVSVSSSDVNMGTATMSVLTSVVDKNTEVTFIAEAAEGYKFVRWTDKDGNLVSENSEYSVTVESHTQLIAEFAQKTTYNVVVHEGTAKVGETVVTEADKGETVTITATAKDGYEFVNWTSGEDIVSTDETFTIKVVGDIELTANFREIQGGDVEEVLPSTAYCTGTAPNNSDGNHYSINKVVAKVNGTEAFTWNGNGDNIQDVSENCVIEIKAGDVITLVVSSITSENGKHSQWGQAVVYFDWNQDGDWEDSGESTSLYNNPGVVQVDKEYTITVPNTFAWSGDINAFKIRLNSGESPQYNSYGAATPCQALKRGILATFKAKKPVSATVTSSRTIKAIANFADGSAGTVTVNGKSGSDTAEGTITLVATPTSNSQFVNWTLNGAVVGTSTTITDNSEGSKLYVANFKKTLVITAAYASSQEASGEGAGNGITDCLFDKNESNFWHSQWQGSEPGYPHWFMVKLDAPQMIDAFNYVSRGTGTSTDGQNNGNILNYKLYISESYIEASSLPTVVKTGTFSYSGSKYHNVTLDEPVYGQYVMLYATGASANGRVNASCAEFYLYASDDYKTQVDLTKVSGTNATVKVTTDAPATITVGTSTYTTTAGNLTAEISTQSNNINIVAFGGNITNVDLGENVAPQSFPETVTEITLRNTSASEVVVEAPALEKITVVSDASNNVAKVSKDSDLSQGVQVVVEKEIYVPYLINGKTPTYFNFLSMPFAFNTANIEYLAATGWATAEPENQIRILLYDSQKRANGDQNTWRTLGIGESVDIAANEGFVIVGNKKLGDSNYKMKLRFTSATEAYKGTTTAVTAKAYRNESGATSSYDTDWNFNGVPYLTSGVISGYTLYFHTGYAYNSVVPAIAAGTSISAYQGVMYQAEVTNNISKYIPVETASVARNTNASEDVFARAYISVDDTNPAKIILCDESSENFVVNEDAWYLAPTADVEAAAYFNIGGANASVTVQPAASELPMTVYTGAGTQHRITLATTDGNYDVYLKDAVTDEVVCLNDEDYTFTATAKTTIANRFTVSMIELTGIIEAAREEGTIKAVVVGDVIKLYGTEEGDEVTLYNTNGMVITNTVAEDGVTSIATSAEGVIIIKVAEETVKVVK